MNNKPLESEEINSLIKANKVTIRKVLAIGAIISSILLVIAFKFGPIAGNYSSNHPVDSALIGMLTYFIVTGTCLFYSTFTASNELSVNGKRYLVIDLRHYLEPICASKYPLLKEAAEKVPAIAKYLSEINKLSREPVDAEFIMLRDRWHNNSTIAAKRTIQSL
jgi:hypothetical protein